MGDHLSSEGRIVAVSTDGASHERVAGRIGALVEIIDPTGDNEAVLLPTIVRVNGTDVGLIAEDGGTVNQGGSDEPTTVTLVLLASRVEIKSEQAAQ